jgi:hypothetical protein
MPYIGFNKNMARAIIDNALMGINREEGSLLTDEFCFVQLNNCLEEVQQEAKRYSFYQKNRLPIRVNYGQMTYKAPADINNQQILELE